MKRKKLAMVCFMIFFVLNMASCGSRPQGTDTAGDANVSAIDGMPDEVREALTLYEKYMEKKNLTGRTYTLLYLDDNEIPELLLNGDCEAAGNELLYLNAEGKVEWQEFHRLCYRFLERQGLIVNCGGHMGMYYDIVFELKDGRLKCIGDGAYCSHFTKDGKESFTYYWENKEVSYQKYEKNMKEVYPDYPYSGAWQGSSIWSEQEWMRDVEDSVLYNQYKTLDLAYEGLTGTLTADLVISDIYDFTDESPMAVKDDRLYYSAIFSDIAVPGEDSVLSGNCTDLVLPLSGTCEWLLTEGKTVQKTGQEDFMDRFHDMCEEIHRNYNYNEDEFDDLDWRVSLTVSVRNGTVAGVGLSTEGIGHTGTAEPGKSIEISGTATDQVQRVKQDIGDGKELELEIRELAEKREEDEFFPTYHYQIRLYLEKSLIQTLEMISSEQEDCFWFEDINADGYYDLCCNYYYGANGGTMSYCLWSPAEGKYVETPKDMYYGNYSVDCENRRLYVHEHSSAVSGTELSYQWYGETGRRLVGKFKHDVSMNGKKVHVWIKKYIDGEFKVISDYRYAMEEYQKRFDEIWSVDNAEFLWEEKIRNKEGEKRIIRYARIPKVAETGYIAGYIHSVYVFREDSYLEAVIEKESKQESDSISWDDEKKCVNVYCGGETIQLAMG